MNGRLRCLGPAQHLKLRFGNGFEVNIKLMPHSAALLNATLVQALTVLRSRSSSSSSGGGGGGGGSGGDGVNRSNSGNRESGSIFAALTSRASGGAPNSAIATTTTSSPLIAPISGGTTSTDIVTNNAQAPPQPAATQMLWGLDEVRLKRSQVGLLCEGLGKPHRQHQIAPYQPGALLHEAFLSEGEELGVPLRMFLEWWLWEDTAEQLHQFMCGEFGGNGNGAADSGSDGVSGGEERAKLLERSTAQNFRYRVLLSTCSAATGSSSSGIATHSADREAVSPSGSATGSTEDEDASTSPTPDQAPAAPAAPDAAVMQSALSDIFAKFEAHKAALRILEYSVGQTTLEQIFNQFASQQENPEVQAANEASASVATSAAAVAAAGAGAAAPA